MHLYEKMLKTLYCPRYMVNWMVLHYVSGNLLKTNFYVSVFFYCAFHINFFTGNT